MTARLRIVAASDPAPRVFPHDPERRGLVVHYHGAETICPGCHRQQFWVGRLSAECAFCSTALPIGAA